LKRKALSVLAGVGAPLILTAHVSASFLGITAVSKPNEFGLIVCSVYAVFDQPGDLMMAVAGTADAPLLIQVEGGGTFYNHAFGGDSAPGTALIAAFPILAYDTFITIGARSSSPDFPDATVITPGFPDGITGTQLFTNESGWAVTPIDPQSDPFNTDYSSGNGEILIAQFATANGTGFSGTMLLRFVTNGSAVQNIQSFFHVVPAPGAVALLGMFSSCGTRRRRRREGRASS